MNNSWNFVLYQSDSSATDIDSNEIEQEKLISLRASLKKKTSDRSCNNESFTFDKSFKTFPTKKKNENTSSREKIPISVLIDLNANSVPL